MALTAGGARRGEQLGWRQAAPHSPLTVMDLLPGPPGRDPQALPRERPAWSSACAALPAGPVGARLQLHHRSGETRAVGRGPPAQPPGAAPPPAAGRWQAASRQPGGPPPPGCLAKVVRRTYLRIAVDRQLGSQERRPPTAQEPTGPRPAPCGVARPSTPHPLRVRDPRQLRQRQGRWLAASYSDGRAASVVGNSSAKPTSSTNAPARPMLRIGRPACHQRRARLAPRSSMPRLYDLPWMGRASVDQEPQGAW
jgi:hypothetical protein